MRKLFVATAIALVTASCAAQDAPDPEPNLFGEYVRSTHVKNDRFHSTGSSADRMANFAAYYTPEDLQSRLLLAFPCTEPVDPSHTGGDFFDTSCDLTDPVLAAVDSLGGTPERVNGRVMLVKHDDGSLELLTVFVSEDRLIDGNGDLYADLADFRDNNDVLTEDDIVMAPQDITGVPGEGKIVTVYGHTASNWVLWLLVAAGVVVVLAATLVIVRRRRSRRLAASEPTVEPAEPRPL